MKAVTLVLEPFTIENGLLTPTFKASVQFQKIDSKCMDELTSHSHFLLDFFRSRDLKQRNTLQKRYQLCIRSSRLLIPPLQNFK